MFGCFAIILFVVGIVVGIYISSQIDLHIENNINGERKKKETDKD